MSSPVYTVGLETSGRIGSIALLRGEELVSERTLGESGRRHARTLVTELDLMLTESGLAPRDIGILAVSIGPGSFTGLRVGVVCAKTWAYATRCRLVAVETFCAIAEQSARGAGRRWVIDDALRGDVFAQAFDPEPNGQPQLLSFEQWLTQTAAGDFVSGPGASVWNAELEQRGLMLAPVEQQRPMAGAVARLGARRAARGVETDPFALTPLYIRRSAAEEKLDSQKKTIESR